MTDTRTDSRISSRAPGSRLTDAQVSEILEIYAAGGGTYRQLAARYGVSSQTIADIVNRVKWKHIGAPSASDLQDAKRKVSVATAREIYERYAASAGEVTYPQLAAEYGLGESTIKYIVQREDMIDIDAPSVADLRAARRAARNAEIAARYAAGGITLPELAAEYELSVTQIRNIIARHGTLRAARRAARNAEIAARYAAGGVTYRQIAAEYELSVTQIASIFACKRALTAGAVDRR